VKIRHLVAEMCISQTDKETESSCSLRGLNPVINPAWLNFSRIYLQFVIIRAIELKKGLSELTYLYLIYSAGLHRLVVLLCHRNFFQQNQIISQKSNNVLTIGNARENRIFENVMSVQTCKYDRFSMLIDYTASFERRC
jgi:hypothetical protein